MTGSAFFRTRNIVLRLARADIAFYLLLPLMIVLVIGTVAQKYMGLYAAQHTFFSSFFFWAGAVPFPGGYTLIGALSLFLSLKFVFKSRWSRAKAGIHLTHLGVLVLLWSGFLTALSAEESYMMIPEGAETPYIYDYTARELSVFRNGERVLSIPLSHLEKGQSLGVPLPFSIRVLDACRNCEIIKREDVAAGTIPMEGGEGEEAGQGEGVPPVLKSMAQFMALVGRPVGKNPEEDLSGVTISVEGAQDDQDGVYIAFEGMPKPIEITRGGQTYSLLFGKKQRILPFALRLEEFEKVVYPGTQKARNYWSKLAIIDGDLEWPSIIEMNQPLRYKGYTFYQSSFDRAMDGTEISVLSVVKNKGRLFPYIGTFIIAVGLILHVFFMAGGVSGKKKK